MSEDVNYGTDIELADSSSFDLSAIDRMQSGQVRVYSSFVGDDTATKLKVFDAITNAERVDEHLGETINLRNVVIQPVSLPETNPNTGVVTEVTAVQVVLVDEDGTAYAGMSKGLFSSMERLFGILGQPSTWEGPVPIKVVQERTRRGFKVFTVRLAAS